jgi:integrase
MAVKLLRYVKSYLDRHGKPRHYFRRKGYSKVPLPPPGSPGFMAAYEAANTLPMPPAATCAPVRFLPGSLGWAIERFMADLGANPTAGVSRIHKVKNEHQPWPDDVLAAFEAHAPGHLRLAVILMMYTGQRRSDVVRMRWSQFDGEIIEVAQQQKTGEFVAIPCHHRLRSILSALPHRSEYILTTERGQPYQSAESLAAMVRRQLHAIGIRGYSVHGLRKNAAQALAEAGCSISEIMAITGHRSPGMALHYAKRAEKKRLARAAIDRWEAADKVSNLRTKRG